MITFDLWHIVVQTLKLMFLTFYFPCKFNLHKWCGIWGCGVIYIYIYDHCKFVIHAHVRVYIIYNLNFTPQAIKNLFTLVCLVYNKIIKILDIAPCGSRHMQGTSAVIWSYTCLTQAVWWKYKKDKRSLGIQDFVSFNDLIEQLEFLKSWSNNPRATIHRNLCSMPA